MATAAQIARVTSDYSVIAGEPVTIEFIGGTLYAFGSELATLRLFHKMNLSLEVKVIGRAGFSDNLGKFYFSLENVDG